MTPQAPADVPPEWSNVHAPDARKAATRSVVRPPDRRRALRAFLRNPNALVGVLLLAGVALAALLAPALFPGDPLAMVGRPVLWPAQNPRFPLGTDRLGRDVLAGLMHGARVSLAIGFAATAFALTTGVAVGAVAGYCGGRIDAALVKLVEIFQAVPGFILLIVLVAIAQPSTLTLVWAIALVSWPQVARLTRAEVRAVRAKEFVEAARSLGYGHGRIIVREILPNALPPIIVTASVMVATAILMESALAFMGLSDPNVVSWGSMIGSGRELLRTAWPLTAIPGLAIVVTVLALNLLGDGLNDALNPRLSAER
ncbi:ABC transporter permease [Methylopila sp. Yamaguchi]|uniref:ABC transporter permease n=1 Tax=Methylopila sp. Yamaguchi TaxID=1437817 RepID=UPI001FCED6FB|nr:ABC transporter permease [Methylopila sp. Yamaguchi]